MTYFHSGKDGKSPKDQHGRTIDFGRTAADYEKHRPGFPGKMFDAWQKRNWFSAGQKVLDLGSGTGTIALNLAERGLEVVAIDRAPEMLAVAEKRAKDRDLKISFQVGVAEDTQQKDESFDLVIAGQCWWWFEAQKAIEEVKRILKPGGRLIICSFNYIPVPGSAAYACEEVILKHNPGWSSAGNNGISPEQVWQLTCNQFLKIESYSHDQNVPFTHEDWRGRLRACNGVGASLSPKEIEAVDADFQERLSKDFPGEISVLHRIFVASGTLAK